MSFCIIFLLRSYEIIIKPGFRVIYYLKTMVLILRRICPFLWGVCADGRVLSNNSPWPLDLREIQHTCL